MDLDQLIELLIVLKGKATGNDLGIRLNGKEINKVNYSFSQDSNHIYDEFIDIVTD